MSVHYKSCYDINFSVDEQVLSRLEAKLSQNSLPSPSKIGIGFLYCRSLPYVNERGFCLTPKCILNSLASGRFGMYNLEHSKHEVVGNVIDLFVDNEDVTENIPVSVYGVAALYKDVLNSYGLTPDDVVSFGTSSEVLYNDFDFYHKGAIIRKDDAPKEWLLRLDDFKVGKPVYWENARVGFVLGGASDDAEVDFKGDALTEEPADSECSVLLAVANNPKNIAVFTLENKGGNKMTVKDENNQPNENTDEIIEGLRAENEELRTKIEEAQASLASEKVRADEAVSALEEKNRELRFSKRVESLNSLGIKYRSEREDFIKSAEEDEFNEWVKDMKEVFGNAKATSSKKTDDDEELFSGLTKETCEESEINPHL